ncbi:inorganic triphosphatase [Volucribacter amazonae]|uniref:CYTH domain-containing protein n=1 Tax=Volucribacter amazonae TaxID=256731 RepID=A0A9X4PD82_9PAST|nr:CYTH domain-containing protein [Volucribacter amazonae]MDG6896152.1 hypothetical protein [Volucribacter amazonae]
MNKEIELKLTVNSAFADFLSQQISDFHLLEQKERFLTNCYYDTAEHFFAKHQMGLRVRGENEHFVLTLKTKGQVQAGLHIRPEYNMPLFSSSPTLQQFAEHFADNPIDELADKDLYQLEQQLIPIFRTDFCRQSWQIDLANNSEVEVALDRGEIIVSEKAKMPICEVEFELTQGNLADLFRFIKNLTLTDGIRLSSCSKAERGYQLAKITELSPQDWVAKWCHFLTHVQQQNSRQILTALLQYEQQLIEETVGLGADYFADTFIHTVERVGAFFNLYHYYQDNAKLLGQTLEQRQSIVPIDEDIIQELIETNDYLYQGIKQIIRQHSEKQNNQQAMQALIELLHLGSYVPRLINLLWLTQE